MSDGLKFSRVLRVPDDLDELPQGKGGVYSISFRFPTSFELGLSPSVTDFEPIVDTIKSKVGLLFKLSSFKEIRGEISDDIYGSHLRSQYTVHVKKVVINWVELFNAEVDSIERSYEHIDDLISVLQIATSDLPPIYVGLAKEQSIKERIWQHRNGDTGFSRRLIENQIHWSNLGFRYLVIPKDRAHHLRRYEKIIQSVTLPALSRL